MTVKFSSLAVFVSLILQLSIFAQSDPLPSWKENHAKGAILSFVADVTEVGGQYYVPAQERIATFDQDGTLWVEHPLYTQFYFALDNLKRLAREHASILDALTALLNINLRNILQHSIQQVEELVTASHAGMTVDQFQESVKMWLQEAIHPRFKRPFTELVYQPMLEVIQLLKKNDFKVYIVSGGGQEFIRSYAEVVYGIPPECIIGTAGKLTYDYNDGEPLLRKDPAMLFLNDKGGKPEGINLVIGRRPIAAFGNSDGDRQMLQWTQGSSYKTLQLLVHHDDPVREYAYDVNTKIGTFSASLMDEAHQKGWLIVSMKNDWKVIFK